MKRDREKARKEKAIKKRKMEQSKITPIKKRQRERE